MYFYSLYCPNPAGLFFYNGRVLLLPLPSAMGRAEFLEKCREFSSAMRSASEGGSDCSLPLSVAAAAFEKNEFFTPLMQHSALKGIARLLEEESIGAFVKEVEKYGEFESVREKNKGKRIGIIMAGNIPGVGFSDLFCTLALGFTAVVKFSSKDDCFMRWVANKLLETFSEFEMETPDIFLEDAPEDFLQALIFAGSDESKAVIERAFERLPLLARGSRFSFGVISPSVAAALEDLRNTSECQGLVSDCFLYFGLGCRSISYLFVPKGFKWDLFIAEAQKFLTSSYCGIGSSEMKDCAAWKNSIKRQRAIALLSGRKEYTDLGFLLLNNTRDAFPPLGVLNYSEYNPSEWPDIKEIAEFEKKYADHIQKKYTNFGIAQLPALTDWQDGVSTVDFLENYG